MSFKKKPESTIALSINGKLQKCHKIDSDGTGSQGTPRNQLKIETTIFSDFVQETLQKEQKFLAVTLSNPKVSFFKKY